MKILRKPEMLEKVGQSYASVWRQMQAGTFPQPVQLGPNSVGWLESEIDNHIASLPRGHLNLETHKAKVRRLKLAAGNAI
jgi:prophage regulatory protein